MKNNLIAIFALLTLVFTTSCNKKESETREWGTIPAVYRISMSGGYLEIATGDRLMLNSRDQSVFDKNNASSGQLFHVSFYIDSTKEVSSIKNYYVDMLEIIPYSDLKVTSNSSIDTVGTDGFIRLNSSNEVDIDFIKECMRVTFGLGYNDMKVHTFGLVESVPNALRNDTLFFELWHNAHKDGAYTQQGIMRYKNLSDYNSRISADSVVVAMKYKAVDYGNSETKTIYKVYKPR